MYVFIYNIHVFYNMILLTEIDLHYTKFNITLSKVIRILLNIIYVM